MKKDHPYHNGKRIYLQVQNGILRSGCCALLLVLLTVTKNGYTQDKYSNTLLKSVPVSFTPLSFWDSDLALSAGVEYRFHSMFSARLAADYIYSGYNGLKGNAAGFRIRPELRYYIAGHKLMDSRSRVWPYIAAGFGNKWVNIERRQWATGPGDWPYEQYISFSGWNRQWHIIGKAGMQTVFGRNRRFLFDISTSLGRSRADVRFDIPDDAFYRDQILERYSNTKEKISRNRYSGWFDTYSFEACFGFRWGR